MLRSLALIPLVVLLAAAGCNGTKTTAPAETSSTISVDEPFRLGLGETVEIEGQALRFVDVVEDSRCPVDVACVWEGRAKVQLAASLADGEESRQVLTLPYGSMTEEESASWTVGGMTVTFVDLIPAPGSADASSTAREVELRVDAAE
ncbi:MAG TPA: hypothetical protein EYQ24_09530 [Bacteroidetes bacterium]|nr:hypothetical protein [Bacteroidota bacterium]HIL56972.1 hypothetical protein [Rhodothermales bacterium]